MASYDLPNMCNVLLILLPPPRFSPTPLFWKNNKWLLNWFLMSKPLYPTLGPKLWHWKLFLTYLNGALSTLSNVRGYRIELTALLLSEPLAQRWREPIILSRAKLELWLSSPDKPEPEKITFEPALSPSFLPMKTKNAKIWARANF